MHLMIVEPQKFIPEVAATGAYMMNVHYEACTHLHRTVAAIKETGMKAGVTLNPHTPICLLEDIIQDVDMVLLMSVNPGFGGQRFIEHSVDKVARLREMIDRKGLSTMIEVDGGVNLETGKRLVDAGVRGKPVDKALAILTFTQKKAAVIIKKALESAIANAEHNDGADIDKKVS